MADIPDGFVQGYVRDVIRLQECIAERHARGDLVMASQVNGIQGSWQKLKDSITVGPKAIFLRDAEVPILGRHRRPYLQRSGTCVSRGMARGLQVSLDWLIAFIGSTMIPVELSFAAIYSLARHEVGRDRCGSGDGAMLCDAAKAVHDYGVMTTQIFTGISEDKVEQQAVHFAAPGVGTPAAWIAASKGHTAKTFSPDSLMWIFDCLATGYGVPYASGWVTGQPNAKGVSRLGSAGGHCRCFTGAYTDDQGIDRLISSESWGRFPAGQPQDQDQTMDVNDMPCVTVMTSAGPVKLAPGDVGVDAKQFWDAIESSGEAWAVGAPNFQGTELADLTGKPVAA